MSRQASMLNQRMMFEVFLSYGYPDREPVQNFYYDLKSQGISPIMDVMDLRAGEEWRLWIKQALRRSQLALIFFSHRTARRNGYFQDEIRTTLDIARTRPPGDIFLIPVRLDDCPIPEGLEHYHCAQLSNEVSSARLMSDIRQLQNRLHKTSLGTEQIPELEDLLSTRD